MMMRCVFNFLLVSFLVVCWVVGFGPLRVDKWWASWGGAAVLGTHARLLGRDSVFWLSRLLGVLRLLCASDLLGLGKCNELGGLSGLDWPCWV
jgi:hypothetical protein